MGNARLHLVCVIKSAISFCILSSTLNLCLSPHICTADILLSHSLYVPHFRSSLPSLHHSLTCPQTSYSPVPPSLLTLSPLITSLLHPPLSFIPTLTPPSLSLSLHHSFILTLSPLITSLLHPHSLPPHYITPSPSLLSPSCPPLTDQLDWLMRT